MKHLKPVKVSVKPVKPLWPKSSPCTWELAQGYTSVSQEVVHLYLEGYTQGEIVKKRAIKSLGIASNILGDFRSQRELDIVAAAENTV